MNKIVGPHHADLERFFSHIYFEPNTGCWLCDLADNGKGYCTFWLDGERPLIHRVSYTWFVGPIPDGYEVDHKCNIRCCACPAHLQLATTYENTMAEHSMSAARRRSLQTHCIHGHEYTEATLMIHGGRRECRTCHNERRRRK